MMHLQEFLQHESGYKFKTFEDAAYFCVKLHNMGYTWGSGKSLDDLRRLKTMYGKDKILCFMDRINNGEKVCGTCWDDSKSKFYTFERGYEVELI